MAAEDTGIQKAQEEMSAVGPVGYNWVNLNPAQIKGIAQAMALSGMFPDIAKDSAKAFVKIMAGQEMGLPPFQAMSDISIIQGKAALGGNGHASKVKSSGKYDYKVVKWDTDGCEIEFFEKLPGGKKESLGTSSFTKDDAKNAGLTNSPNYSKYPRNMFFNRAMTNGVRTFCPDALNGINAYTPEELGADVDGEGNVVKIPSTVTPEVRAPKASQPQAEPVIDNKTTIQLIGDLLREKGFDEPTARQKIALSIAGTTEVKDTTEETWGMVLDTIEGMSTEELSAIIKPPLPADDESLKDDATDQPPAAKKSHAQAMKDGDPMPDDFLKEDKVVEVTDDVLKQVDDDNAAVDSPTPAPKFVVPEFKKSETGMIRPEMRKFAKKLFEEIGLKTEKEMSEYTKIAIEKDKPADYNEMLLLIEVLVDEANETAS